MAADQLSKNPPDGTILGQSATDKIAAFGATPVVQPSGNAGVAMARGLQAGVVATFGTSQTPIPGIVSNSSTGISFTLITNTSQGYALGANDVVIVNKPASQAGLGVGNARVSGANSAVIQFCNLTAAVITATAEKYALVALSGFPSVTPTLSPAAVAPVSVVEQQFTVTGLRTGDALFVAKPTDQAGLVVSGGRVVSNNLLGITLMNVTTATITPTASEVYRVFSLGGLDAVNNDVAVEFNAATRTAVAVTSTAEQQITLTGLQATDMICGTVEKPSAQAGLGIAQVRVSGAAQLGILFSNNSTATITPTAAEVYKARLFRANPAAPCVVYSPSLAPVAVAPSTTAEQGFTVTGLLSNTVVWVNKPSVTAGLGVVGCRVSGSNALAINFANLTAATITPPTEAYVVANFQMGIGDDQSIWIQAASQASLGTAVLLAALRSAAVTLGLHAGV